MFYSWIPPKILSDNLYVCTVQQKIFNANFLKMAKMQIALCRSKPSIYRFISYVYIPGLHLPRDNAFYTDDLDFTGEIFEQVSSGAVYM